MHLTNNIEKTKCTNEGRCCVRSLVVSGYCGSCNCMHHSNIRITSVIFGDRFINQLKWWYCITIVLSLTRLLSRFMWIMGVCIPISVKSQFNKKIPRFTMLLGVFRVRLFSSIPNCEPGSGFVITWQMRSSSCDILTIWKEWELFIFKH
jgi:hypothetical protein